MVTNQNYTGIGLSTATIPESGPKAMAMPLDFSAQPTYPIDLENLMSRNVMDAVQSLYVDNSLNTSSVIFTFQGTQQTVTAPAKTQGYYTVLAPNPVRFTATSAGSVLVNVIALNVPVSGCVWSTP